MLQLYGRKNSVNVMKVLLALTEIRVPYERIDAGGTHELNKANPRYLQLNPNGLIPTISDGGFHLWESHTIVRYLANKYDRGHQFYPAPVDIQGRANVEKWMDWGAFQSGLWGPIFIGMVRTPPEKRNMPLIEESRQKLAEQLQVAEHVLAKQKFLAGDSFTVADMVVAPWLHRAFNVPGFWGEHAPALPHVEQYYRSCAARDSYATHVVKIPIT